MSKSKAQKLIKLFILCCLTVQACSPVLSFAETTDTGTSSEKEEETTESSIPKLSESLDQTLEELKETKESSNIVEKENETVAEEVEHKNEATQSEQTTQGVQNLRSPRLAPYLDISQVNRQPTGTTGFQLTSVSVSNKSPWILNFDVYSVSFNLIGVRIWGATAQGPAIDRIYYQARSGTSTIIEVEIPAELRGRNLECEAAFQYAPASGNQKAIWHHHTGSKKYYTTIASAYGSVTPNRPISLAADGTSVSGSASFSLTNLAFSGSVPPRIYFFEDRNQAAASIPNLGQAQAYADCGVSGNTISFSNKALTRGKTYYYRYVITTNYSQITIYSAFNDGYRITMPDITFNETSMQVSIRADGLALNASIPYSLVSPFEGTATSIKQSDSRIRFYNSLANAGGITNYEFEVVPDVNTTTRLLYKNNYSALVPGKVYWYRFAGITNYTGINRWSLPNDSRKITMPKLTLAAPTITPVGTNGTINAAVTSTLLGTNANYPANTSKVYIFDSEQKANNNEIASRVLEGNLTHNGTQMKVDNLNGLTPGKKYWARFYVGSNYTAINQWSAVVPFSTPYAVNEEYYDLSGTHLKSETVTISDGSTYQPSEADINHNSKDYIYYGWLDASETPGVDTPKSTPFTSNDNSTVKLIYLDKDLAFFLRNVPKFDFGTVEASDTNQDYALDTASYGGSSDDLSVEYLDKRAASTGWSLKAQMSELAMVQSPSDKLTNATLTRARKLQVLGSSNSWSDTLPSGINDYGGSAITLNAGGGEVNVFSSGTASAAECSGIWRDLIDFDSVKLHVQGSTALSGAKYSGKVTWTLDDTP